MKRNELRFFSLGTVMKQQGVEYFKLCAFPILFTASQVKQLDLKILYDLMKSDENGTGILKSAYHINSYCTILIKFYSNVIIW